MRGLVDRMWVRHRQLLTYGFISGVVTLLDMVVSFSAERLLVAAGVFPAVVWFWRWDFKGATVCAAVGNTVGVLTGFITQYFWSARRVFNSRNPRTFAIYLVTFGLGLLLQDGIVAGSRAWLFASSNAFVPFLVSKGLSIVIPFFLLYYVRKALIVPDPVKEPEGVSNG